MRVELKPLVALILAVATAAGVVAAVIETPSSAQRAEPNLREAVDEGWVFSGEDSDPGYLWSSRHGELADENVMVAAPSASPSGSDLAEWAD